MDTSELYIKMCDCPEIQQDHGFSFPSTAYCGELIFYKHNDVYCHRNVDSTEWKILWLPRQDQIQEMMWNKDGPVHPHHLFTRFLIWHERFICVACYDYATPEQMWLGFYMHEKHGKEWIGGKWVKEQK